MLQSLSDISSPLIVNVGLKDDLDVRLLMHRMEESTFVKEVSALLPKDCSLGQTLLVCAGAEQKDDYVLEALPFTAKAEEAFQKKYSSAISASQALWRAMRPRVLNELVSCHRDQLNLEKMRIEGKNGIHRELLQKEIVRIEGAIKRLEALIKDEDRARQESAESRETAPTSKESGGLDE